MKIEQYKDTYNKITGKLMEHFAKAGQAENLVFSPMSVIMLMGIAADAVDGRTRDEILSAIGAGLSQDEMMALLKELQEICGSSESLLSSNAVCVRNDIAGTIKDGYEERLEEIFVGKLFASSDMVEDVNAWVKEKTRGMIEGVLDESMRDILACLMNAIAFEAAWMEPYEDFRIHEGKFTNADGTVSRVQMLHSSEDKYIEDMLFTGFVKPYEDEKYAFVGLLPKKNKGKGIPAKALAKIDFSRLLRRASYENVQVTMPEFKYDFEGDLKDFCRMMGIETLFTPAADFSPMSDAQLMVDAAIHKARIEVDRKGTRAAALSALYTVGCAPRKIIEVCLDRPFVYAIMDMETGLPVFAGVCNRIDG